MGYKHVLYPAVAVSQSHITVARLWALRTLTFNRFNTRGKKNTFPVNVAVRHIKKAHIKKPYDWLNRKTQVKMHKRGNLKSITAAINNNLKMFNFNYFVLFICLIYFMELRVFRYLRDHPGFFF